MRFGKLLLLGLLLYPLFVSSSNYGRSKWLGMEHGLNNATIHGLFSTEKSGLWLATDIGLSRYDGYHFRNYPLTSLKGTTDLGDSRDIRAICGCGDGLLFLQLAQGGIACFDVRTERFLPVNFDVSFDRDKITSLFVADGSQLYIGTTTGLYSAEVKMPEDGDSSQLLLGLSKSILTGHISKITGDGKENLYLCIDGTQVLQYSMGTQQTKELELNQENGYLSGTEISVCGVFGDYLMICDQQFRLLCYDVKRGECRFLQNASDTNFTKMEGTSLTGITSADGQTFYLSTLNGIYCIKFDSKDLMKAPFAVECISEGYRMSDVLWDTSHRTLWASSYGGGIAKIEAEAQEARRILLNDGLGVTGVRQDAQGAIWLTASKKGVWKSAASRGLSGIRFEQWAGVDVQQNYCIYKDKNGGLWLGNEKAEIVYIDPLTNVTKSFLLAPDGERTFSAVVKSICLDSRNRLWVVTSKGLVLLDRKTGNCSMPLSNDYAGLKIYSVVEDNKENIWVGTANGLKQLNMLPGKTELVGEFEKQAGSSPGTAYVLYIDANHILWAAYADKVMRIDVQKEEPISVLGMPDKLKNGRVNCMVADQNGNIWMGCNSGMCVVQKSGSVIYNSLASDYVQTVACLNNGQILWGGSQGLSYDVPQAETHKNELVLSDVWVNGKPVVVGEEVFGQIVLEAAPQFQKQLVFGSGSSSITLHFTDLAFGDGYQPIAYRLLPDEEWQMGTLGEGISYDGLANGNYTLQVKLIYPTGEGAVLELPIEVRSAWWVSSWMYLVYVAFIIGLLIGVYYYLRKKGQLKDSTRNRPGVFGSSLATQGAEKTTLLVMSAERQDKKTRSEYTVVNLFLQRFMQELRTPLSVTKVLLKEVANKKGVLPEMSSKLLIAYRNSVGVLNACELLLEVYRQGETGNHLRVAAYSPAKLVDALLFSMSEFLKVYSVQLSCKKAEVLDDVWVDRNKVEFLLHNLLSNAFIHIRYVGRISLSVTQVVEDDQTYCVIEVSDDGNCTVKALEDMTEAELLSDESVTTELGLDVMQSIVRLHHGSLLLNNDPKVGTTLTLKLPTDKDVFASDPEVTFVETEDLDIKEDHAEMIDETPLNAEDENRLLMQDSARPAKEQGDKETILIIEDYPDIRLYLKVLFEKEYNVLLATNGVEGVELAQKEIPDLIICDIMMPLKDGYECCKEVKEGLDTCHIPFIMLTAKVEDEDVVRGLETGADDYILKPFTPSILKARVKSLIQGRVNLKQMYANLLTTPASETEVPVEGEGETRVEDPFISMVIKIIEENIQEPDFNVKKLAFDLNMSQPTLYRKVKQYTDFTIIELIRGVRLRKAATLLKQKCYAVQEVAEMVGYNDVPTFRKHFVDMFGTTPSTYASGEKSGKDKE